ncbi:MAG: hypothetical protein A3F90_06880 [Deltaproteobacteria bacterium RIFCSPLOWO2_12_FULL_60_19]|nr:MAG: hypothetical protein A3F90_06880 [Deltaproteobacteria bacterium RIFCSPLOWO2_12_FULL_60_19]
MKRRSVLTFGLGVGLILLSAVASAPPAANAAPAAGGQRSDFALFDGTQTDTGAACGAKLGSSNNVVPFTYHIAVSNWSAATRVLRVVYADGDIVRYQIPPNGSFSLTQAAGGTAGVDDLIRIFDEGPAPLGLAGSMSILTVAAAKPHPSLGANFCVTLTTPAP